MPLGPKGWSLSGARLWVRVPGNAALVRAKQAWAGFVGVTRRSVARRPGKSPCRLPSRTRSKNARVFENALERTCPRCNGGLSAAAVVGACAGVSRRFGRLHPGAFGFCPRLRRNPFRSPGKPARGGLPRRLSRKPSHCGVDFALLMPPFRQTQSRQRAERETPSPSRLMSKAGEGFAHA